VNYITFDMAVRIDWPLADTLHGRTGTALNKALFYEPEGYTDDAWMVLLNVPLADGTAFIPVPTDCLVPFDGGEPR